MATIVDAPIPAPDLDYRTPGRWAEQERTYIEALAGLARAQNGRDHRIGRTVRWSVADGYAVYVVWKVKPLTLAHVSLGDGYAIPAAMARGLTLADIDASLKYDDLWNGMADEHERFISGLPLGAVVHYDNGFGQFVRCVRVEGERGKRLMPVALVGNWQKHDLPRRKADGSVDEGHDARKIRERSPFEPNYSNLWEAKDAKGRAWSMRGVKPPEPQHVVNLERRFTAPFDPTTAEAIDLTPPALTVEDERVARLAQTLNRIRAAVEETPRERTEEAYRVALREVFYAIDAEVLVDLFGPNAEALARN